MSTRGGGHAGSSNRSGANQGTPNQRNSNQNTKRQENQRNTNDRNQNKNNNKNNNNIKNNNNNNSNQNLQNKQNDDRNSAARKKTHRNQQVEVLRQESKENGKIVSSRLIKVVDHVSKHIDEINYLREILISNQPVGIGKTQILPGFGKGKVDSKGRRQFQLLPRHLRRRSSSHNLYRIPKPLRAKAMREVEKSQQPPKIKRRNFVGGRGQNESKVNFRKHKRRPKYLLIDYSRRLASNRIRWLETHLWSRKRMHLQRLWGFYLVFIFPLLSFFLSLILSFFLSFFLSLFLLSSLFSIVFLPSIISYPILFPFIFFSPTLLSSSLSPTPYLCLPFLSSSSSSLLYSPSFFLS